MGCGSSFDTLAHSPEFQEWSAQFSALQLSKDDLKRLHRIFCKVDADGSGNIGLAELLAHIDVDRTRFSERIFSIFDEDGSGEIDFREFVLALWNYCTLTKATLDMFAFDLYDGDNSGELSASEIHRMLKDIYGAEVNSNFHAKNIANELASLERARAVVDVDTFRVFVKNHQALLFPAFQMQLYLQKNILGKRFWEKNANRRIRISKGSFIPIAQFLAMHVNAELLQQTIGDASSKKQTVDIKAATVFRSTGTAARRRKTQMLANIESNSASAKTPTSSKKYATTADTALSGGTVAEGADLNSSMLIGDSITDIFNRSAKESFAGAANSSSSSKRFSTKSAAIATLATGSIGASNKSKKHSSSKAPEPMASSGKFSGYNTTEDMVRELGSGNAAGSSKASRRRSSFGDEGAKLYAAGADGASSSSKSRKQSVAAPNSAVLAGLTMSAVSSKAHKSPIEAWQSLPENGTAGAEGSRRSRNSGVAAQVEQFAGAGADAATKSGKSHASGKSNRIAPTPISAIQEDTTDNGNNTSSSSEQKFDGAAGVSSGKKSRRRSVS